jgi:predicted SAM-dependent methyltransferase
MPISSFSFSRPVTSYAKVQAFVARVIRNRRFQIHRPRIKRLDYLDIGCGPNTHEHFINLDYLWHPTVDLCWDVTKGLPFTSQSLRGVFSEHCLEHFPLPAAVALLREVCRVLRPDATLRLVVPDGELYLRTYASRLAGDDGPRFPYEELESADIPWTPIVSVNRIFYQDRDSLFGHRVIYDFQLLAAVLHQCGFGHVERSGFGRSRDSHLLIDSPGRRVESLYVEATPNGT